MCEGSGLGCHCFIFSGEIAGVDAQRSEIAWLRRDGARRIQPRGCYSPGCRSSSTQYDHHHHQHYHPPTHTHTRTPTQPGLPVPQYRPVRSSSPSSALSPIMVRMRWMGGGGREGRGWGPDRACDGRTAPGWPPPPRSRSLSSSLGVGGEASNLASKSC